MNQPLNAGWSDIQPIPTGKLAVNLGQAVIEHGKRYLLTANLDGTPNVKEIDQFAAITNTAGYLDMLVQGNGTWVSDETLEKFVAAASAMLEERREYQRQKLVTKVCHE